MENAIALFDNSIEGLTKALAKLNELGKLWHFDDAPCDCGFDDREVELLTKFQADVWLWAYNNDICPFSCYPTID